MNKAILVMDMPKNCAECNLCGSQNNKYFCIPDNFTHDLESNYVDHTCESKPNWCPLKTLPNPIDVSGCKTEITKARAKEYNALLAQLIM